MLCEYKITKNNIFIEHCMNHSINGRNMTHTKIRSIANMYRIDIELVEEWSKLDPTNNMQYLIWIARLKPKKEDYGKVREALKNFHDNKTRLAVKDINKYSTLGEVMDLFENVELDMNVRSLDGIKVIYDNIYGRLLVPTSYNGSKELSRGTRWCTTDKETYYEYTSKGPLYVWIDNNWSKLGCNSKKFQIHFETLQFMNERDEPISKDLFTYFRRDHEVISKLFLEYENELEDLEEINEYIKFVHGINIDRFMNIILDNPSYFSNIYWKELNGRSDIDDIINKDDEAYVKRCIESSKFYDPNRVDISDENLRQYIDVIYKNNGSNITDPILKIYHQVCNNYTPCRTIEKIGQYCGYMTLYKSGLICMNNRLLYGMKKITEFNGKRDYEYERSQDHKTIYSSKYNQYLISLGARYNTLACEEEGITQKMVDDIDRLLYEYDGAYKGVHDRLEGYDREIIDCYGLTDEHLKYIKHNLHKVNLDSIIQSPKLTRENIIDMTKSIEKNNPIRYLIHSLISDVRDETVEFIPKDLKYYPYYWRKFGGNTKDEFMELNKLFINIEHVFHYITRTHI